MVHAFGDLHSSRKVKYLTLEPFGMVIDENLLVAKLFNVEHATFRSDVSVS